MAIRIGPAELNQATADVKRSGDKWLVLCDEHGGGEPVIVEAFDGQDRAVDLARAIRRADSGHEYKVVGHWLNHVGSVRYLDDKRRRERKAAAAKVPTLAFQATKAFALRG